MCAGSPFGKQTGDRTPLRVFRLSTVSAQVQRTGQLRWPTPIRTRENKRLPHLAARMDSLQRRGGRGRSHLPGRLQLGALRFRSPAFTGRWRRPRPPQVCESVSFRCGPRHYWRRGGLGPGSERWTAAGAARLLAGRGGGAGLARRGPRPALSAGRCTQP